MLAFNTAFSFIILLLGCILQIYYIADQFFDYTTTTRVSIGRQTSLFVPTLVFCTPIKNLMEPPIYNWYQFILSTPFNLWFDRTCPRLDIVNSGYNFRDIVKYKLFFNQSQLRSMFQVGKLIMRRDMCYSLRYKNPFEFDYRVVTSTSDDPILVGFILNPNFLKRETSLNFFVHSYDSTFHGISNSLAAKHFSRVANGTSLTMYKIILTYKEYDSFLLPSPYDTNCYDYRPVYKSERHCYGDCHLNLSLEIQKMVPMSVIKERRFNAFVYPKYSALSLKQKNELEEIKSKCTMKCQKVQCNNNDFVPILIQSIPSQKIEVVLQASPDPLFKMISQPKINLIDFITYIFSCISFWFGISCSQFMECILMKCKSPDDIRNDRQRLARLKVARKRHCRNRTSHVDIRLLKKPMQSKILQVTIPE